MVAQLTTHGASDPRQEFAVEVVRRLRDSGHQALWAGGCVRDALMGKPPKDYDVATTAPPEFVVRLFGRRRTIPVGASFGVIIVQGSVPEQGHIEVATFRSDGPYSDGRRPDTVQFCTPEEDAARRDFTINGMFYDPLTDRLVDYVGGEDDLRRRLVRAIGDPDARFDEDKLRMLRAIRFTATLEFELDHRTEQSICRRHGALTVVSVERINAELHRMLAHPTRANAVRLLHRTELLQVIFPNSRAAPGSPEFSDSDVLDRVVRILGALRLPRFEPSLLALMTRGTVAGDEEDQWLREEASRLRLANSERDSLCWLFRATPVLQGIAERPLHRIKPLLAHPDHDLLLDLAQATAEADGRKAVDVEFCREFLRRYSPETLAPPPLVNGRDVLKSGVPAGPRIHSILSTLRDEQLDERLADRASALARLQTLANLPDAT